MWRCRKGRDFMRTLLLLLFAIGFLPSLSAGNIVELHYVLPEQKGGAIATKFADENLWLSPEVVISDLDIEHASLAQDDQEVMIMLKLTDRGAKRFDDLAEAHLGDRIAILVRGKVVSAPVVRERKFGGNLQIAGSFSKEEAVTLIAALNTKRE